MTTDDWPRALEWMRTQTPPDAVIMSWWDYGYWIETLGERATLTDNLTVSTARIQEIAQILYSDPDEAWGSIRDIGADYVLVYVAAQNANATNRDLYLLSGGGDELKKTWVARIAGLEDTEYFYGDFLNPTEKFDGTLLSQLIPFSHVTYAHAASGLKSVKWQPGFDALYEKDVKLPAEGDGPLRLAYSSPSFEEDAGSVISAILIYELNPDYVPRPQAEPAAVEPGLLEDLGAAPFLNPGIRP